MSWSGEVQHWVGNNRSGVVVFGAPVLILAAFFLDFRAGALVAALGFGSCYLELAIFLENSTFDCLSASVAG